LATELDERAVRRRGVAAISQDEEESAQGLLEFLAEWDRTDRPSIEYLLAQAAK
jgi:hypothetical protein